MDFRENHNANDRRVKISFVSMNVLLSHSFLKSAIEASRSYSLTSDNTDI